MKTQKPTRLPWDKFFMRLAVDYSGQSTCPRAKVGCVLVHNNKQIGAGFNGAASGDEHCTEVKDCAVNGHCERSIHAEVNAILQGLEYAPQKVRGCTAYITHFPCINCYKVLIQAGVSRIIYKKKYGDDKAVKRMIKRNINKKIILEKYQG